MLTGENGLLTKASDSKTKTIHASVLEQMQLQASSYILETMTKEYTGTLADYLEAKNIITAIEGEEEKWEINVETLLGSNQSMRNGTYPSDVYVLEKQILSGENIANKKVATTKSVKIAAVNTSKTYNVVYYEKNDTDFQIIGNIVDGVGSSLGSIEERLKAYFNSEEGNNGEDNESLGIYADDFEFISRETGNSTYVIYENTIYKIIITNPEYSEVNPEVTSVERLNNTDLTTFGEQINLSENMYYLKDNGRDIDLNRTASGIAYKTVIHTSKRDRIGIYYNASGEILPIIEAIGPQTFEGVGYLRDRGYAIPDDPFEEGYYSSDTKCYYDTSGILVNVDMWHF